MSDQLDSIGDWCRSVLVPDRTLRRRTAHDPRGAPGRFLDARASGDGPGRADGTEWTVLRIGSSLTLHVVATGRPTSFRSWPSWPLSESGTPTWSDAPDRRLRSAAEIDPLTGLGNRRVDRIIATVLVVD